MINNFTNFKDCSGCNLCLLTCPLWQQTRDLSLTPRSWAKALQQQVAVEEMEKGLFRCILCGACEPICYQQIHLVDMILELRRQLLKQEKYSKLSQLIQLCITAKVNIPRSTSLKHPIALLPSRQLRQHTDILKKIYQAFDKKISIIEDDGWDVALAFEAGIEVPKERLEQFLTPLRTVKKLVVTDGLWLHALPRWLPEVNLTSLGQALSQLKAVRTQLKPTDFYIIEARSYHAHFSTAVNYYHQLHRAQGCMMNLDLHRLVIPTTGFSMHHTFGLEGLNHREQIEWILTGREVERIIVESVEEGGMIKQLTDKPVLHLAELL